MAIIRVRTITELKFESIHIHNIYNSSNERYIVDSILNKYLSFVVQKKIKKKKINEITILRVAMLPRVKRRFYNSLIDFSYDLLS